MPSSRYEDYVETVIGDGLWRDLSDPPTRRGRSERDLRITDVSCTVVDGNFPWNLIVVQTDRDVYGVGEAFPGPVSECVAFLEEGLVGHNPLDVDRNVEHMTQLLSGLGGSFGYSQAAVSGIETALWDIAGKVTGLPVYQLLGGKYRDDIQIYIDCHAGEDLTAAATEDPYEVYDPDAYASVATEVLAEGFSALKFDLDVDAGETDTSHRRLSSEEIQHKVDIVRAVTEAVGADALVGFDLHWNFSVETATQVARQLEPFGVDWLEDPVPPENPESHRTVTESTATRILTGENLTRVEGFQPYITERAVDILAPDLQKCGGLLEFRKICALADAFDMPVAPHNISSPVGTVASVHACATVPNAFVLEWHASEVEWWDDLHTGSPLIAEGSISVPEQPGLGIELDTDVLGQKLARNETLPAPLQ